MRGNGIRHETTTTGAGAITLTSVTGWPGYDAVFGTSGTIFVEYTILNSDGVPIEGGIGSLVLSTMVLTRTSPAFTWNGTTYASGGVSALSLSAGTKTVICAPVVQSVGSPVAPIPSTASLGTAGMAPLTIPQNTNNFTIASGQAFAYLIWWPYGAAFDRVRVRGSTAVGGSPTGVYFAVGMYRQASNGVAGAPVAIFDSWTTNPVVSTAVQVSDALGAPVAPPPGFYWLVFLPVWTGGTGSFQIEAMGRAVVPAIYTAFNVGMRDHQFYFTNGVSSLADPAPTPGALGNTPSIPHVLFGSA